MNRRRALKLFGIGGLLAGVGAMTSSWLNRPDPVALQPGDLTMRIVRREEGGAAEPISAARVEFGLNDPVINRGGWMVYERALQALHHSTAGYADIAYRLLIGNDGVVYESRQIGVRGAHVARHNTGAIGICVIGNFER